MFTVAGNTAAGDQHVDVTVIMQLTVPGMQDRQNTRQRPQVTFVRNRSQGVFWSSGWVKEETDLDSDWQIGNDVEHVVATIFRPPRYSA